MDSVWGGWVAGGMVVMGTYLLWRCYRALVGAVQNSVDNYGAAPVMEERLPTESAAGELSESESEVSRDATGGVRGEADAPAEQGSEAAVVISDVLKPIIEALIFASPGPLTLKRLLQLLDGEPQEEVERALAALRTDYDHRGGLQMVEEAGGYRISARSELHEWVRRLLQKKSEQRLSTQALETLAVIAYKQPITGAEVAEIRGVSSSGVVGTLLERQLVKVVGRKQVVGRPFLYATTHEFLNRFGIRGLDDLPKVEEMAEALGMAVPSVLAQPTVESLPFEVEPAVPEDVEVSDVSRPGSVH